MATRMPVNIRRDPSPQRRFNFFVPEHLFAKLEERAQAGKVSVSLLLNQWIADKLGEPDSTAPRKSLTIAEKAMLREIEECNGAEIHEAEWPVAESLLKKGAIKELGFPRGPRRAWRRALPLSRGGE